MSSVQPDLSVKIGGMSLKNPVIAASGCYGFGDEYSCWVSPEKWGGIVMKGITIEPRTGNPPPRLAETPSGLINSIGLQNPGVRHFLTKELPRLASDNVAILVNIAGDTIGEYARLAEMLNDVPGISALELNISCPNVKRGGIAFGHDPKVVRELVKTVRACYGGTLAVKLSPNAGDLLAVALSAWQAGADALSMINTIRAMSIDVQRRRPVLAVAVGGLSGPAVRPVAVRAVWEVSQAVDIPVIGMGGISCARDALEFILAGAKAVAVGTAIFCNPLIVTEITEGIAMYMRENGFSRIDDLVGLAWKE